MTCDISGYSDITHCVCLLIVSKAYFELVMERVQNISFFSDSYFLYAKRNLAPGLYGSLSFYAIIANQNVQTFTLVL